MGAVAAALQERGFKVSGSDENVYPPMSIFLEERGIAFSEGYRAENIPADCRCGRDRQRDQARQSGSGSGPESQTFLPLAAGSFEKLFSARQAQPRCHRHARKNHDHRPAGLDHGKSADANPVI